MAVAERTTTLLRPGLSARILSVLDGLLLYTGLIGLPAFSPEILEAGFRPEVKSFSFLFFFEVTRDSRAGLSPFVFCACAKLARHNISMSRQMMQASDAEI